jgi:hypothetical protein
MIAAAISERVTAELPDVVRPSGTKPDVTIRDIAGKAFWIPSDLGQLAWSG